MKSSQTREDRVELKDLRMADDKMASRHFSVPLGFLAKVAGAQLTILRFAHVQTNLQDMRRDRSKILRRRVISAFQRGRRQVFGPSMTGRDPGNRTPTMAITVKVLSIVATSASPPLRLSCRVSCRRPTTTRPAKTIGQTFERHHHHHHHHHQQQQQQRHHIL